MQVGCLCYMNEERKQRMKKRFDTLSISYLFFDKEDYKYTSPQMELYNNAKDDHTRRILSCILNHLSIISYYYHLPSSNPYIIVCEDDVMIHQNWNKNISYVIDQMNQFNLDIVLLGCLLPRKHLLPGFYEYDSQLWGTQMYIISREYAKQLLDRFCNPNQINIEGITFAADWIITKLASKKAYIYPLLAIEEGSSGDNNDIHQRFHYFCNQIHKNEYYN